MVGEKKKPGCFWEGWGRDLPGKGHEGTFWGDGGTVIYTYRYRFGQMYTSVYICINLEGMPLIFVGINEIFQQKKKY